MQSLIIGKDKDFDFAVNIEDLKDGCICPYVMQNGKYVIADGSINYEGSVIALGRDPEKGGTIVLPVYSTNFRMIKTEYKPATSFKGIVEVKAPTEKGEYGLMIVEKGKPVNDRYKKYISVVVTDLNIGQIGLIEKLAKAINTTCLDKLNIKAALVDNKLNIECTKKGISFELVPTDFLIGTKTSIVAGFEGNKGIADYEYMKDLASRCAADSGFTYTYGEDLDKRYPAYPIEVDKDVEGWTVIHVTFSESRTSKPTDQNVQQVIHVAMPSGSAQIDEVYNRIRHLSNY